MPSQTTVKNLSQRNTVRVRYQDAELDAKGKPTGKWNKTTQVDGLIPPDTSLVVYLASSQRRAILDELPT
jgi:hypothetical protein